MLMGKTIESESPESCLRPVVCGGAEAAGRWSRPRRRLAKLGPLSAWPHREVLVCALLAAGIALAYFPVFGHGFLYCDDPDYVSENAQVREGLTWHGVLWALTSFHASNWHPLTWLSHMLDVQAFGLHPGWHHLDNVLLHTLNSVLLFLALRRLTGAVWRSAVVAGLFALHPLHVESVAWIAERKDVLSGLFFMLTLLAYSQYVRNITGRGANTVKQGRLRLHPKLWYSICLLLFFLGLMSKAMLVTVPVLLLLLDFWPLQRLVRSEIPPSISNVLPLVKEKIPFLFLSAASSFVTFLAQQQGGSVASATALPVGFRLENALVSYCAYVKLLFWPVGLAAYYPYPGSVAIEFLTLAVLMLLGISIWVFWRRKRQPYLVVGWCWYLVSLLPVIGVIQVGMQAMADRYTYLPLIGLFMALVWGISDLAGSWRWRGLALSATSLSCLGACFGLTARQVPLWKDTETLYGHALEVTSNNAVAHQNLGAALAEQGRADEALVHFTEALRIWPDYAEARSNFGFLQFMQGKADEAIVSYRAALDTRPNLGKTHFLLGMALAIRNQRPEAIGEYRRALKLEPNHDVALNNLAWMLATDPEAQWRNGPEAVSLAERLCRLTQFANPQYIGTLAAAYAETGRYSEAIQMAEKAELLASKQENRALAEKNRQLLEFYRAGRPYHETVQVPSP